MSTQTPKIIPSAINPQGTPPTDAKKLGEARRTTVDTIEWLERLTANEDFQRYIDFVKQGVRATRSDAENIERNDPAKRDAFAQRHFGLVAMVEWAAEELQAARLVLKSLDEQSSKV